MQAIDISAESQSSIPRLTIYSPPKIEDPIDIRLLKSLGTDREVAAQMTRKDGRPLNRSTVQLWRKGRAPMPFWAMGQLLRIAIKRNDERLKPMLDELGIPEDEYAKSEADPEHWANWWKFRRDGKPMFAVRFKQY